MEDVLTRMYVTTLVVKPGENLKINRSGMVFYTNIMNCTQAHVGNNDGVDIFARNYEIKLHPFLT